MTAKLQNAQHILLDTPAIQIFWNKNTPHLDKIAGLFETIYTQNIECIVSYITYTEIITTPLIAKNYKLAAKMRGFLANSDKISLYPIDYTVSDRAALIQSSRPQLALIDTIKLATADTCGVDYIVTDNDNWIDIKTQPIILIKDL